MNRGLEEVRERKVSLYGGSVGRGKSKSATCWPGTFKKELGGRLVPRGKTEETGNKGEKQKMMREDPGGRGPPKLCGKEPLVCFPQSIAGWSFYKIRFNVRALATAIKASEFVSSQTHSCSQSSRDRWGGGGGGGHSA